MKEVETKETKAIGLKVEIVRALRRHRVLTKFLKNTKASSWERDWDSIDSGSNAVLYAFSWDKSNEGPEYWVDLYSRMLGEEKAMKGASR